MSNSSSPLIAHIVSQTRQNVEFLMAQNEISRSVGQDILTRLPTPGDVALRDLSEQTSRMTMPSPPPPSSQPSVDYRPPSGPPSGAPSGPPVRRVAPPSQPQPRVLRAKALWSYNENGSEPNDLSFRAGDIIEIVAETNADWWTGRLNGNQGLFPSNYVEKMPTASPPSYPPPGEVRRMSPVSSPVPYNPPAQYAPVYNGPPPQGGYQSQPVQPYNPYTGPPSQPIPPQQVVVQQAAPPSQPAKSSRFGGLGQVLATSAVGGLGFGAGSAIGNDLVQSIF